MNYKLPEEYIERGFNLAKFGAKSLVLKRRDKVIFVFGSDLDLNDEFISRLCESYLDLTASAMEIGVKI